MKIFFYNETIKGSRPHKPLPQRELMRARRNYHENCISRRSFLKLPVCWRCRCTGRLRRFFFQHCSRLQRSQLCCRFRHRQLRCKHQAVDIPHRRLGQG